MVKAFVLEETKIKDQVEEVYRTLIGLGAFNEPVLFVQPDFHGVIQIFQITNRRTQDEFNVSAGHPVVRKYGDRTLVNQGHSGKKYPVYGYPQDLEKEPEKAKAWLSLINQRLQESRKITIQRIEQTGRRPLNELYAITQFVPYKRTGYKTFPAFEEGMKNLIYRDGIAVFPHKLKARCKELHPVYEGHCERCFDVMINNNQRWSNCEKCSRESQGQKRLRLVKG